MDAALKVIRSFGPVRAAIIATGLIAAIGLFGWLLSRVATPDQALLYGDLDVADAARIVDYLGRRRRRLRAAPGRHRRSMSPPRPFRAPASRSPNRACRPAARPATSCSTPRRRSAPPTSCRTSTSSARWKASWSRSIRSIERGPGGARSPRAAQARDVQPRPPAGRAPRFCCACAATRRLGASQVARDPAPRRLGGGRSRSGAHLHRRRPRHPADSAATAKPAAWRALDKRQRRAPPAVRNALARHPRAAPRAHARRRQGARRGQRRDGLRPDQHQRGAVRPGRPGGALDPDRRGKQQAPAMRRRPTVSVATNLPDPSGGRRFRAATARPPRSAARRRSTTRSRRR